VREYRVRWRRAVWVVCIAVPLALIGVAGVGAWTAVSASQMTAPTTDPLAQPTDGAAENPVPAIDDTPAPEDGLSTSQPPAGATPPPPPEPAPFDPLHPGCPTSTTMSVWAHYDDDLLFFGDHLANALAAGQCVRTVYLTGSDAGKGADYRAGREAGIIRAYDSLRGATGDWVRSDATLSTGARVTITWPADNPNISLVFFGLPDGNLNGKGFPATGDVSLDQLGSRKVTDLSDLGGSYRIGWHPLVDSVRELITDFSPASFTTHMPGSAQDWAKGDHSDHRATGYISRQAWLAAAVPGSSATYAIGYQSAGYPVNVSGTALERKVAAFQTYSSTDSVTSACKDYTSCLAMPKFGAYIQREYLKTEAEVAAVAAY